MKIIQTNNGLKPIGPYSQAVQAGNMVFVSGVVGISPATNALVTENIKAEVAQLMNNIKDILEAGGLTMASIVKSTVFLINMNDFAAMNEIYGSFFTGNYPARETVQVSRLPLNANVEISVVAVVDAGLIK